MPEYPPMANPDQIRGLYLTGYTAGGPRFEELLKYVKSTGLNAMVIDVKDDDGRISYLSDVELAKAVGAASPKIKDPAALIQHLERNGIYSIGRVVVFADPILSKARPEWAIQLNGSLWRDRRGITWTNPYERAVWEYNVAIAKEAVRYGFREIQFDYVRFPEKDLPGWTTDVTMEQRVGAISGFLTYARDELKPLGAKVSADVFGLTTTTSDDMRIGQEYATVAGILDYISPMIYPSHYGPGNYGLADPEAKPYETILHSMIKAREKTPDMPLTRHRPWIQDFSLRHRYGANEVTAQLRALAAVGIGQFLLWNPGNVYTAMPDYKAIDVRPANENGKIMIVAYHEIGKEDRWSRTPENMRRDLEELYRRGYRPVNVADIVNEDIDIPEGMSPVAITFDDATEGQFRYIEKDGRKVIDPNSAVGILLDFNKEHPDWGLKATFYVNEVPFGDAKTWQEKVRFLVEKGFEVGNHTLTHADLGKRDTATTAKEIALVNERLQAAVPGYTTETLALPYGAYPANPEAVKSGVYESKSYNIKAFLLVGAGPAPSPNDPKFDPFRLPRIQAVDSSIEPNGNLDYWLRYFDLNPWERYVSDGK